TAARLAQSIAAQSSVGLEPGGDFENLDATLRHGWRHFQQRQAGITSKVELSSEHPRGGRYSLRMNAIPDTKLSAESVIETPPVWITSGPIKVKAGQQLIIRGWAKITQPITGSVDGLIIMDSLGG